MPEVCSLIWLALVGAFRSRVSLEAENTILRHQLNVLRRKSPKRPTFGMLDRLIFAGLYRFAPQMRGAVVADQLSRLRYASLPGNSDRSERRPCRTAMPRSSRNARI